MRWTPGGESQDVEDRRDDSGGGGGGFRFGGMHVGIGGAVLLILSFVFETNFFALPSGGGSVAPQPAVTRPVPARNSAEKPLVQFVSFVLDDTQKTWTDLLPQQAGRPYHHVKLVLFRDSIQSGCGGAESATGSFYCPNDEKVYIDLGFYDQLKRRFGAPGEFAQAYEIAHQLGHHVQNILGIERKLRQLQEQNPRAEKPLSVKMELQADCFAGIRAHSTQQRWAQLPLSGTTVCRKWRLATSTRIPSHMAAPGSARCGFEKDWIPVRSPPATRSRSSAFLEPSRFLAVRHQADCSQMVPPN